MFYLERLDAILDRGVSRITPFQTGKNFYLEFSVTFFFLGGGGGVEAVCRQIFS